MSLAGRSDEIITVPVNRVGILSTGGGGVAWPEGSVPFSGPPSGPFGEPPGPGSFGKGRCASATSGLMMTLSLSMTRSEEHTSELQSLMRSSYAVFCLKKNKHTRKHN